MNVNKLDDERTDRSAAISVCLLDLLRMEFIFERDKTRQMSHLVDYHD